MASRIVVRVTEPVTTVQVAQLYNQIRTGLKLDQPEIEIVGTLIVSGEAAEGSD